MYGMWSPQEYHLHINNLEIRAVFLAISFPITSSGLLCDCVNRQHISRSLHPGTEVNTLPLPVSGNQELTRSLKEPQHLFLVLTYQVVSTPWRTVCLANTSSFRLIGHLIRKWPTRFFSRSVIQWSTCLRPETTTDTLNQKVANQIFLTFGYPMVDLFATRDNHRLPLYVSPFNVPAAWAVDALSFAWD